MSMPHTIFEAKLVQHEDHRERSLASHQHIMHLPQGKSLLKRLIERLRAAAVFTAEARKRPSAVETGGADHPPAFSN